MTFDEIVTEVCENLNLTDPVAVARVGRRVNRRYRRVTTRLGMVTARRLSFSFTVVPLTRDQTISGEKVLSIKIPAARDPLRKISFAEMTERMPTTGNPTCWATVNNLAVTEVVRFDSTMDAGLDLDVEVETTGTTLAGAQVPAFPESWHDILVFGATADELTKKEKILLAKAKEDQYDRGLSELVLHLAANGWQDQVSGQMNRDGRTSTGSSSGGGSGGTGTVTHTTGGLTANQLILGNSGADIKPLGSLGTTSQFLKGNAAGAPTFSAVAEADIANLVSDLALKAPLASPTFTGVPAAPTAAALTNTTQLATTAFVTTADNLKANLASPTFTGVPAAPTAAISTNTTQLATCAFVEQERETVFALTDGATPALDASLGNVFTLAAAGDRTIAVPTNARSGKKIIIRHLASGGARTLALNSGANGFRFGSDITALTQTASGKTDYIGCIWNATDSKWDVVAVAKGF